MGNSNKNRLLDQLGESNVIKQKIKKFQSEYKTKEKDFKATVLIIDDEPEIITFMKAFLENDDYKVLSAFTVADAKKKLQSDLSISLILTDLGMPHEDGFEILQYVNTNIRFSHIPIIVVTGHSNPEIVKKALEKGAKEYLVKPFTRDKLIEKIHKILKKTTNIVLLVTSDELVSSLLQRSFSSSQVKLITIKTGNEAKEKVKSSKVDVIITDFVLEDMTGIDLLEDTSKSGFQIPFLFIEDTTMKISHEKIISIGGHGFIRKPFNNTEIHKIVSSIINEN